MPSYASPNGIPRQFSIPSIIAVAFFCLFLITVVALPAYSNPALDKTGPVFVIPIHDTIDRGLAYFVKRSLAEAEREGASSVILHVDTLGGRVDAALDIRDSVEGCAIPNAAYIDKRAISAGALICLATDTIAMAPGSSIGAATPISIGPTGEKIQLGEKEISYIRGEFRATAEHNGHSPLLAEAMVDPDVEVLLAFEGGTPRVFPPAETDYVRRADPEVRIETVSEKGKLLTMTTTEAARMEFASSTPASLDEFISSMGFDLADKVVTQVSWSENIVRFLTHPIVSGLLLSFGVLGIFFELQTPTWGISGTIGAVCLLLFFSGHYLAGLAGIADLLLFVVGLILLGLELFVIPGFGVAGISGLLCIVIGIYLALVRKPIPQFSWDYALLGSALTTFFLVLLLIVAGMVIIWKMVPDSRFRKLLVLSTSELAKDGYTASAGLEALAGATGKSLSHLRPAGKALFGGEPFEVQTEGEFIEKGTPLKVVKVVGNKVFVMATEEGDMPS